MKLIIENCGLLKETDNNIPILYKEIPLEFPTMPLLYNLKNTDNFLLRLLHDFIEFNYIDEFGNSTTISKDLLEGEDDFKYSLKIPIKECPIVNNKNESIDIIYTYYKDYIKTGHSCDPYVDEIKKLIMNFQIYKIQNEKGLEEVKVHLLIKVQSASYMESIMIKHNFSFEKIDSFLYEKYSCNRDIFKRVKAIMNDYE